MAANPDRGASSGFHQAGDEQCDARLRVRHGGDHGAVARIRSRLSRAGSKFSPLRACGSLPRILRAGLWIWRLRRGITVIPCCPQGAGTPMSGSRGLFSELAEQVAVHPEPGEAPATPARIFNVTNPVPGWWIWIVCCRRTTRLGRCGFSPRGVGYRAVVAVIKARAGRLAVRRSGSKILVALAVCRDRRGGERAGSWRGCAGACCLSVALRRCVDEPPYAGGFPGRPGPAAGPCWRRAWRRWFRKGLLTLERLAQDGVRIRASAGASSFAGATSWRACWPRPRRGWRS